MAGLRLALWTLALAAVWLGGCGAPPGGPTATPTPTPGDLTGLQRVSVSPTSLPFHGGVVTLSAQAPSRTASVTVTITGPASFRDEVRLARVSASSTWRATWTAPANGSTDGTDAVYQLVIVARDSASQVIDSAEMDPLTVAAAEAPPTPPEFPTPVPTATPA